MPLPDPATHNTAPTHYKTHGPGLPEPSGNVRSAGAAGAPLRGSGSAALELLAPLRSIAHPGRGVQQDHLQLLGGESSFCGSFSMMKEELRQPGTAHARDCQPVRSGELCARGGMDTP